MINMSNLTEITDKWSNLPYYIMYICQGIFIGGSNLLIVLVITHFPALRSRKEYIVIAAQTLADGCNQMGYLVAGVYRIIVISTNNHVILWKPWQCVLVPHSLLWLWTDPLANLMLVIVSLDRLLAVFFPLQYIGWPSRKYSWGLIGSAYAYTIGVAAIGLGATLSTMDNQNSTHRMTCSSLSSVVGDAGFPMYKIYYQNTSPVLATTSILLYIIVVFKFRRKNNQVGPSLQADQERELKIQRKLVYTIGISSFCTLIFNIIPYQIGYMVDNKSISTMAWILTNLNPLCNVIIYPLRQQVIIDGIKAYFSGKTMPDDIRMWRLNKNAGEINQNRANYVVGLQPKPHLKAREAISQRGTVRLQPTNRMSI